MELNFKKDLKEIILFYRIKIVIGRSLAVVVVLKKEVQKRIAVTISLFLILVICLIARIFWIQFIQGSKLSEIAQAKFMTVRPCSRREELFIIVMVKSWRSVS